MGGKAIHELDMLYLHLNRMLLIIWSLIIFYFKLLKSYCFRNWHPTYTEVNTLPSVKSLTKVVHQPRNQGGRRIAVLNKLFMKNITDIMSTGSSSIDIVGRGIEISKVR